MRESEQVRTHRSQVMQVRRSAFRVLMAGVLPTERFLDVGCGTGHTLSWAAALLPEGRVLGLDPSQAALDRARERVAGVSNAGLVLGDVSDPALSILGPFDRVYSAEALCCCPDPLQALDQLRQRMSEGGKLACLMSYYAENRETLDWPERFGMDMIRLSQEGWRRCFRDAGFDVLRQERLHPSVVPDCGLQSRAGTLFFLASA